MWMRGSHDKRIRGFGGGCNCRSLFVGSPGSLAVGRLLTSVGPLLMMGVVWELFGRLPTYTLPTCRCMWVLESEPMQTSRS